MEPDATLDCGFTKNGSWFRYRAAAIIIENDCVLLAGNEKSDYFYSVGGGVHTNETAEDAVKREVFEETGFFHEIERLAFIHENFFTGNGILEGLSCHEVAFYFLMKPRGSMELKSDSYCPEGKETMHWVPLKDLPSLRAFPTFFAEKLHCLSGKIEHIVTRETPDVHLAFPQKEHEAAWQTIIAEFKNAQESISPYGLAPDCEDYDDFLQKTMQFYHNDGIPEQFVQAAIYFLMDEKEEKILGAINIRYRLNDYLEKFGGHIGYGVAPGERRKGYAAKMLKLALDKCREIGLARVLITCNKDNIASAKTIVKNGGTLENELAEDDGTIVQRYWITL